VFLYAVQCSDADTLQMDGGVIGRSSSQCDWTARSQEAGMQSGSHLSINQSLLRWRHTHTHTHTHTCTLTAA